MSRQFDGDRLRASRLRARMTQQELAAAADLSVGTVSRLETGREPAPQFRTMRRLAKALKISEEELERGGTRSRVKVGRTSRNPRK